MPGVHEENIATPASATVTTWCYSLLVLFSLPLCCIFNSNETLELYPMYLTVHYENHKVPYRDLPN